MNATNRTYNGTRHAEFIAINSILSSTTPKYSPDILQECDLYVTVEPCIMCASLLRQFGIRRVFFGAGNDKFGGTGGVLSIHRGNGAEGEGEREGEREGEEGDYEVSGGWLREEAIVLLRRFYVQENERAPEPRSKGDRVLKLEVEPLVDGRSASGGIG
jgi:tRNA-specific adenosine deaminase 2